MKELIKELCSSSYVSGCEVSDNDNVLLAYLKCHNIPYEIDTIGNIVFQKTGKGDKVLMLVAHYDEIGFSVKYIDDNGYIYFSPVGGIDVSILRGQKVVIKHNESLVCGVIGVKPVHMRDSGRNRHNEIDISDLWIDIGITEKEDVENIVAVGDQISFSINFTDLNNNVFTSKSIDNRVGVATLLSVYEKIKSVDVNYKNIYFVLSSQEELGLRGARVAGYTISPDVCIAIDVTHATDYPTINKHKYGDVKINKGAVIPVGSNFSSSLQEELRRLAAECDISYQIESLPSYSGTDVSEIQLSRSGCKSGLISIPCRYMHTPVEVATYGDVLSVVEILTCYCCK
jgi:endoglucanase